MQKQNSPQSCRLNPAMPHISHSPCHLPTYQTQERFEAWMARGCLLGAADTGSPCVNHSITEVTKTVNFGVSCENIPSGFCLVEKKKKSCLKSVQVQEVYFCFISAAEISSVRPVNGASRPCYRSRCLRWCQRAFQVSFRRPTTPLFDFTSCSKSPPEPGHPPEPRLADLGAEAARFLPPGPQLFLWSSWQGLILCFHFISLFHLGHLSI